MTLIQLLQSGGALRYRPPNGFYVVLSGLTIPVSQSEAQAAVKAGRVHPAGISAHGVYVFSLNDRATDVRRVRNHPQTLPTRPASVPNALPDVHPLRRKADSKTPAPVPADSRAAPGQVPAGAGRLAGAGAQRERVAGAGKEHCVGCGSCAGEGVAA